MQTSIAVGISLPREIIAKIDNERGDITRSRYVLKIVQKAYRDNGSREIQKNNVHSAGKLTYSQPNEPQDT